MMDFELDLIQARIGMMCSFIVMIPCYLIAVSSEGILFWVLFAVAFGALLFFSWFNRCPICGRGLGRHHWFIKYCPYCGTPL